MKLWHRIDNRIARLEQVLITGLLTTMIVTAFLQIVLRNFFSTGLAWGDALVRYLVVWVGFVGAALAVKEGKHIAIEILSHLLSDRSENVVRAASCFFSALICGLLTWAAVLFVRVEALMGGPAVFGLPAWLPQVIIPAAFAVMTLRFGFQFIGEFFVDSRTDSNPLQNHRI